MPIFLILNKIEDDWYIYKDIYKDIYISLINEINY